MQYRIICESLAESLFGSHMDHGTWTFLLHNLRREIAFVDAGIKIPGGYFACLAPRGKDGCIMLPEESEPAPFL